VVAPYPSKIKAMIDWSVPVSLKGLRDFLGHTGFYRRFVKAYASIAQPLTELLKKGNFKWTPEAQQAFDNQAIYCSN